MISVREDGLVGEPMIVSDLVARVERSPLCNPVRRTHIRLAIPDDGEFIHRLRSDDHLGRHLTAGAATPADQSRWLEAYKRREAQGTEAYFMIVHEGRPKGAVRLYDFLSTPAGPSFNWGSWIIEPPRPKGLVKASALYVYEMGFGALGFAQSHFEVIRRNTSVIDFHMRSGATKIAASPEKDFFLFRQTDLARLADDFKDAWNDHFLTRH